ncbi:MAG: rhomboid family intramembrane serine protease [Marinosulfonomonas sp.]|nr:rhomboid family intramembrane serine protease [Marinosulfonomonas sp.]
MFPIKDHNPSGQTPYVVYTLIAANVIIYLATLGLHADNGALGAFYNDWAMIPARITAGEGWHTLVSSLFLHAGVMHLAGNMLFLWIFGDNLEEQLGHAGFLIFYVICGAGADLAQVVFEPHSGIPTVGASGAIAGILGGYLLLFPRARVDILFIFIIFFKVFPVPAWVMLGLWFALQLFSGLTADVSGGGVAYWAHAGGFVLGFVYVLPLWRKRGGAAYWRTNAGRPPHPDAEYELTKSRIPRVKRR